MVDADCTRRLSIGTYYLAHMEYLCHDFQCVAAITIVVFADYACNKDDLYVIEYVKKIHLLGTRRGSVNW